MLDDIFKKIGDYTHTLYLRTSHHQHIISFITSLHHTFISTHPIIQFCFQEQRSPSPIKETENMFLPAIKEFIYKIQIINSYNWTFLSLSLSKFSPTHNPNSNLRYPQYFEYIEYLSGYTYTHN